MNIFDVNVKMSDVVNITDVNVKKSDDNINVIVVNVVYVVYVRYPSPRYSPILVFLRFSSFLRKDAISVGEPMNNEVNLLL